MDVPRPYILCYQRRLLTAVEYSAALWTTTQFVATAPQAPPQPAVVLSSSDSDADLAADQPLSDAGELSSDSDIEGMQHASLRPDRADSDPFNRDYAAVYQYPSDFDSNSESNSSESSD